MEPSGFMKAIIKKHEASFGLNEVARKGPSNGLLLGDGFGITAGQIIHQVRGGNFMIYGIQYAVLQPHPVYERPRNFELKLYPEGVVIYTSDFSNEAVPHCAAIVWIGAQYFEHTNLQNVVIDPSVDMNSPIRKLFSDDKEAIPATGAVHRGLTDLIQAIESHNRIVHQYSIKQ